MYKVLSKVNVFHFSRYHLELESQLQSKERELMKQESQHEMDRGRLASSKTDQQVIAAELEEERRKGERMQQLFQEATDKQIALESQKQALQQQIEQVCGGIVSYLK